MSERLHALWVLVTAPFPAFLIVLIVGAVLVTSWLEREQ